MQRLVYIHGQEIWDLPVEGGAHRNLGLSMDWMRIVKVHPNRHQVFFNAEPYNVDIWVMENFLPEVADDR